MAVTVVDGAVKCAACGFVYAEQWGPPAKVEESGNRSRLTFAERQVVDHVCPGAPT